MVTCVIKLTVILMMKFFACYHFIAVMLESTKRDMKPRLAVISVQSTSHDTMSLNR